MPGQTSPYPELIAADPSKGRSNDIDARLEHLGTLPMGSRFQPGVRQFDHFEHRRRSIGKLGQEGGA